MVMLDGSQLQGVVWLPGQTLCTITERSMPSRAKRAYDPVTVEPFPRLEIEPPMVERGQGTGAMQSKSEVK
jgi:hypothetical protein